MFGTYLGPISENPVWGCLGLLKRTFPTYQLNGTVARDLLFIYMASRTEMEKVVAFSLDEKADPVPLSLKRIIRKD